MSTLTIRGRLQVTPPHPQKIFCLTWGGHVYLPTITDHLLLIDRNVFSKISSQKKSMCEAEGYWIEVFERVSCRINPIMLAYEGCKRRQPTLEEFQAELAAARDRLVALYPSKEIIAHSRETSAMLYGELKRKLERQAREAGFLHKWAPYVTHRPNDRDLMVRARTLLGAASDAGLRENSLVHVALLSCLAEEKRGEVPSPGRSIVKPRDDYTLGDSHNAVSDIHSLEFLITSRAANFDRIVFCTMDRGLAMFWLGLRASQSEQKAADTVGFRFTVDEKLCPRFSDDQLQEVRALI